MGKWKMAKALGRAIVNKSDDHPIKQAARESISKDIERKYVAGDMEAGDRAAAFNEGYFEGGRASRGKQAPQDYYTHGPKDVDAAEARLDEFTDKALAKDFDFEQAFNDAIKTHVKEDPNRSKFTEDELRKECINMLKSGADISDVFEYLRGNTDYIKVNPTKLKERTIIRTSPKSAEDADVGIVWDYLADRIDNPEKLDYIMNYHDEFIRQELRNGTSPEDIARTLDTDIFD